MTPAAFMAAWRAWEAAREALANLEASDTTPDPKLVQRAREAFLEASARMAGAMKAARHHLGLSVNEAAETWGVTPVQIRRMELKPKFGAHRPVNGTMARLVYLWLRDSGREW